MCRGRGVNRVLIKIHTRTNTERAGVRARIYAHEPDRLCDIVVPCKSSPWCVDRVVRDKKLHSHASRANRLTGDTEHFHGRPFGSIDTSRSTSPLNSFRAFSDPPSFSVFPGNSSDVFMARQTLPCYDFSPFFFPAGISIQIDIHFLFFLPKTIRKLSDCTETGSKLLVNVLFSNRPASEYC